MIHEQAGVIGSVGEGEEIEARIGKTFYSTIFAQDDALQMIIRDETGVQRRELEADPQ